MFKWLFPNKEKKKVENVTLDQESKDLLVEWVHFYEKLNEENRLKFDKRLLSFLEEVTLTGVGCEVELLDKLLIASSAIIPVFNFPNWVYTDLNEVLLRPKPFNKNYDNNSPQNITGMVGNGYLNGKMVLSKTSLRLGFQAEKDKKNVGIHEFIHLIDGADGAIDGIPKVLMEKQYALPWMDMVYQKIKEITEGENEINPYGATNEQEFLAVTSEYFLEHPLQLKKKHPELYEMLHYFFNEK